MIHKTVPIAQIPHEFIQARKNSKQKTQKAQIELGTIQPVATQDISPCLAKISQRSTCYQQHQRPEPEHCTKSSQTLIDCSSRNLRSPKDGMHAKQ